jgi:predicted acyl esterase
MAVTSKEASEDKSLGDALMEVYTVRVPEIVRGFPMKEGTTILKRLPSYERWVMDILTHSDYDDDWKRSRGYGISEYYSEHSDVPTLYLGGWYDSYTRNTCESYMALSRIKKSPQRLIMGPWIHAHYEDTFLGRYRLLH